MGEIEVTPDETCPMCGCPVKIVGKTTMHYEPIQPKPPSVYDVIAFAQNTSLPEYVCAFNDGALWMREYFEKRKTWPDMKAIEMNEDSKKQKENET